MASDTETEPLPGLHAKWMAALLGGGIPRESRATCNDCAMRPRDAQDSGSETTFFDPVIKCCTYVPTLHNFLVGRVLSDADPGAQYGRATVQKRIADAVGVTPLGLAQPPVHSLLYRSVTDGFGRSRALRCPHFNEDGGRCGIWRNRNATCSTWFCKHLRGHVGFEFWRESLHPLLQAVERDLARWCVLELRVGEEALRQMMATGDWLFEAGAVTGEALDNRVDPKAYARSWGEWRGREQEFFRRCSELVQTLAWADVLALCGAEARGYARLTQQAYARLTSTDLPARLRAAPYQVAQTRAGIRRVSTYSMLDPLDAPESVLQLLQYFDGRPTADALALIAAERGVTLDAALVRKLVDFKLLVPPETPLSA